jgi:hypothetical protein
MSSFWRVKVKMTRSTNFKKENQDQISKNQLTLLIFKEWIREESSLKNCKHNPITNTDNIDLMEMMLHTRS